MSLKIGITGATGKMGGTVISCARESEDYEIGFAVDREASKREDVPVEKESNFRQLILEEQPDVIVDFTAPEASLRYSKICADTGTPIVIGTTGFSEEQVKRLKNMSKNTPILKASNFSKGVQALRDILKTALKNLEGYDIEIVESHHNSKVDSPSGTAKTLLRDVKDTVEVDDIVYGRQGESERGEREIGIHSIRCGNIRGKHKVIIGQNEETVEISHEVHSRKVFALGALEAAQIASELENGWHNYSELIE
ncbi:MAG: 4-hydroxy-tetrahydrodipicolinate reductase [Candidatus Nanohaloarchaea archaeon]